MGVETHIVKQGDTLGGLAKQYNVGVEDIASANQIKNPNKISVGQRLVIPRQPSATATASDPADEDWAETFFRFVDSLSRPIQGMAVKLVAGANEMAAVTDSNGCVPSIKCKKREDSVEVHVEKHAARGGGQKHIATYQPQPGKQKAQIQSGMHVEKSGLRTHQGTPDNVPKKMSPKQETPVETRNSNGNPVSCSVGCECPNEDDLLLKENNVYREWVKIAAKRGGMMPQAVAAVMNAESKKVNGKWSEKSEAPKGSATGMTQFLDGTWISEAVRAGTYLNEKARKEGWIKKNEKGAFCFVKQDGTLIAAKNEPLGKLISKHRIASDANLQRLLDLRYEAEFSIMAAMDYGKFNLQSLSAAGYAIDSLNDVEKARIMYLCHHLGFADAKRFIQNTIPAEDVPCTDKNGVVIGKNGKPKVKQFGAKGLLTAQVGIKMAEEKFRRADNDWVKAHRFWLEVFVKDHITPNVFTCAGDKQKKLKIDEMAAVLTKITEKVRL